MPVRVRSMEGLGVVLRRPRTCGMERSNKVFAHGAISTKTKAREEQWQATRVLVVYCRPRVDAVRNLVPQSNGFSQSVPRYLRRCVLPLPTRGDILQAQSIRKESSDIFYIWSVESSNLRSGVGVD